MIPQSFELTNGAKRKLINTTDNGGTYNVVRFGWLCFVLHCYQDENMYFTWLYSMGILLGKVFVF